MTNRLVKHAVREGLTLLVGFAFGLVFVPFAMLVVSPAPGRVTLGHAYRMSLSPLVGVRTLSYGRTLQADAKDVVFTWLVTLAPYLLYQLTRAIVWAVKTHSRRQ